MIKCLILNSSREIQTTDDRPIDPFKLHIDFERSPSEFEIVFFLEGKQYRYGFTANRKSVLSEWLYYVPKTKETKLFSREGDNFEISKKLDAEGIQSKTRHNALFLSVAAQFNVLMAETILEWVSNKLKIISGLDHTSYRQFTVHCFMERKDRQKEILQLIKRLDLGIMDWDCDPQRIIDGKTLSSFSSMIIVMSWMLVM